VDPEKKFVEGPADLLAGHGAVAFAMDVLLDEVL